MYFISNEKYQVLKYLSSINGLEIVKDDLGNLYFLPDTFIVNDETYEFNNYQLKLLLDLHKYYKYFKDIDLIKLSIMNEDDISEFINRSLCFGEELVCLPDSVGERLELFLSKISLLSTFDVIKFSSPKYRTQIVNVLCDFLLLMSYIKESILLTETNFELLIEKYVYLSRKNLVNLLKW